jgi:hypothetical protein
VSVREPKDQNRANTAAPWSFSSCCFAKLKPDDLPVSSLARDRNPEIIERNDTTAKHALLPEYCGCSQKRLPNDKCKKKTLNPLPS